MDNLTAVDGVLERIAREQSADPATDDLTVPLAIELADTQAELQRRTTERDYHLRMADRLASKVGAMEKVLKDCRTSYCGYVITKDTQYQEVLASFWKELQRIDKAARAALAVVQSNAKDAAS